MFDLLQMEWFPAGHGSVLSAAGYVQLDAIIMNGKTLAAGTDSCVRRISNPVTFACLSLRKGGIHLSASSIFIHSVVFPRYLVREGSGVVVQIKWCGYSAQPRMPKGLRREMSNRPKKKKKALRLVISLVY